jgi:hypothetical protein
VTDPDPHSAIPPEPNGKTPAPAVQQARDTERRNWFSIGHIGAGAGLVSALAALVTAVVSVPWITGGKEVGTETTQTTTETAPLTRLLLDDPLTSENALPTYRSTRCSARYVDGQLLVEVHDRFTFCGSDTAGFGETGTLPAARVEADFRFTKLPEVSYRGYGPGAVQLRCRGAGAPKIATAIYAWLSPRGWWGIDHFQDGDADALVERRAPETTRRGEVRRFRLDCLELESGAIEVTAYVDDTKLGETIVANPPAPGDVGVAVNAWTTQPIEAAFSRFRVYGPER